MADYKKIMKYTACVAFTGTILCEILYCLSDMELLFTLAVTFGVTFYHFSARLLVGAILRARYHNCMDYNRKWFQSHPFEERLYKKLKVKQWKNRMPTYDPRSFSLKESSLTGIAQATCQSEIDHEINVIISFLPLFLVPMLGSFWAFFITSLLAALYDLTFVVIQRFNRPRILKLIEKQENYKGARTSCPNFRN